MSINVQITKCFHRDTLSFERGMTHVENMTFVNMDDAYDWASQVNLNYAFVDWHITSIYQDSGNFICFDISDIWDAAGDSFVEDYRKHNPRKYD